MKKTLLCLATLLCGFAFLSCSGDDDEGAAASSPKFSADKNSSIATESVDLSSVSSLTLKNYSYEILCKVPDKNGLPWTASLSFDGEEFYDEDTGIFHSPSFAYIFPENGAGAGTINLCVLDFDGVSSQGKLTVTYSDSSTITVALEQISSPENDEDAARAEKNGNRRRFVGYGYNAFAGYATDKCLTSPVFKIAEMQKTEGYSVPDEGVVTLEYTDGNLATSVREKSGTNIAELEANLNASASASTEFCGFSAELEASYSQEKKEKSENQFAWMDVNTASFNAYITGSLDALSSKYVIEEGAYKVINGLSRRNGSGKNSEKDFATVIKQYGTHVVRGGKLGGQLHFQMTANTSEIEGSYSASAMIKAGYSGSFFSAEASVDASYKEAVKNNSKAFEFSSFVRGGSGGDSGTTATIGNALRKREGDSVDIDEWESSLNDINNCVFIDFNSEEDLIPIYELVDWSLEGGEERYEAFKKYFESGKMEIDFGPKKQARYINTAAFSKITVPTKWSESDSLIKDVYLNGTLVARICNEYIPQLNVNSRVNIIYPANNQNIFYNMGFYPGDDTHYPHSISWDGSAPVLTALQDNAVLNDKNEPQLGALKDIYINGLSITGRYPDYVDDDKVFDITDMPVYKLNAGVNGTYNLVKILDHIYTRDYWHGTKFNDGASLSASSGFLPPYYNMTNAGITTFYYNEYNYIDLYASHKLGPAGWTVPVRTWAQSLIEAANSIEGKKPGGSAAAMFLNGGVLGLNLEKGQCGYRGYWVDYDRYGNFRLADYPNHEDTALGLLTATLWQNGDTSSYSQDRLLIHPSTGGVEYRYGDKPKPDGYEAYYFPLILCKPIK
ncbi:MAC/perforin domain-containing protein [uncultured Treponema sp.]|uniref:MAC/perforin domain-containing protein n=1 Tax=uncultured Treponema sp. TaxID=162155 RepID=UPI00260CF07E|nr:MAC/perforin domain-containing protein [uncultured Treponema sp.]